MSVRYIHIATFYTFGQDSVFVIETEGDDNALNVSTLNTGL